MNKGQNVTTETPHSTSDRARAEVWELIQALVLGRTSPERILELFYWSDDPCALELARASFSMSSEARATLRAFLAAARPQTISVKIEPAGQLVLSSSDITDHTAITPDIDEKYKVSHR